MTRLYLDGVASEDNTQESLSRIFSKIAPKKEEGERKLLIKKINMCNSGVFPFAMTLDHLDSILRKRRF